MYFIDFQPFKWCGPGLNRRHKDFQSFALPTELPHLLFPFGAAKIGDLGEKQPKKLI